MISSLTDYTEVSKIIILQYLFLASILTDYKQVLMLILQIQEVVKQDQLFLNQEIQILYILIVREGLESIIRKLGKKNSIM